jgi:hypothetical protein
MAAAVLCPAQVLVPSSKAQASLSVAVRVRPTLKSEQAAAGSSSSKRDIIRVMDGKIVVVLDPDEAKDYLDQVQNRTKEKRYTFDVAYDTQVCVCVLGGGKFGARVQQRGSKQQQQQQRRSWGEEPTTGSISSRKATCDECNCTAHWQRWQRWQHWQHRCAAQQLGNTRLHRSRTVGAHQQQQQQ